MEKINVIDFTGGLFASSFFYILPHTNLVAQGDTVLITVDGQPLGTATAFSRTVMPLEKITPGLAKIATGKDLREFRAFYGSYYKMNDHDNVVVIVFTWLNLDAAALAALMSIRFELVKGIDIKTKLIL